MIQTHPFHGRIACNEFKKVSTIRHHQITLKSNEEDNDSLCNNWISIDHLPKHSKSSFISTINDNTEIINICDDVIYKYNTALNVWNLYQILPIPTLSMNRISVDYDAKTNDLYLNTLDNYIRSKFYKCEHHKNTLKMTQINIEHDFIENSIVINGEYHIFALNEDENGRKLQHSVLNSETNTINDIHQFETALSNFDLVYIKKEQRMLLFGGLIPFSISNTCLSDIYSLSLSANDNAWIKLPDVQLPSPLADTVCVATNDEQYIVILGGSSMQNTQEMDCSDEYSMSCNDVEYVDVDSIYVLNVNTMSIKESTIHCPKYGVFNAVIPKTHLKGRIIKGFIKRFNDEYVSNDIINIIKSFYQNEYLHLFDRNGFDKMHWKISLDLILNSI